jgi:CspA family cold shock protein
LNARQRRLFEDARKRHPDLQIPSEPDVAWSEADLALVKQGVGDKSSGTGRASEDDDNAGGDTNPPEQSGIIVSYFEARGFGFLRPDNGGRDVFFHVTHLIGGLATDLRPGARLIYTCAADRTGKPAASSVRIAGPSK